jgi:hypothetical protein
MAIKDRTLIIVALLACLSVWSARAAEPEAFPQAVQGSTFQYQGLLTDNQGQPINGPTDFQFVLYDAAVGGNQAGSTVINQDDVAVSDGLFSVALDFGPVIDGRALFLEVAVRAGNSNSGYEILTPRTALAAVPYALSLVPGATITGANGQRAELATNNSESLLPIRRGVYGSADGPLDSGVFGTSETGFGLQGRSTNGTGVYGVTSSAEKPGTSGINQAGGPGLYGESSTGYGIHGIGNEIYGVYGQSSDGIGVRGLSTNSDGVSGQSGSPQRNGVTGVNTGGGVGVSAVTSSAAGGKAAIEAINNDAGPALRLSSKGVGAITLRVNGGIQVEGAGENTPTMAFVQRSTPENGCFAAGIEGTVLDNPYTNGRPDAIIIITPSGGRIKDEDLGYSISWNSLTDVSLLYDFIGACGHGAGRWVITRIGLDKSFGSRTFNVLVINP